MAFREHFKKGDILVFVKEPIAWSGGPWKGVMLHYLGIDSTGYKFNILGTYCPWGESFFWTHFVGISKIRISCELLGNIPVSENG